MEAPRNININTIIADKLLEMAELRSGEKYRQKAYKDAAAKIRVYHSPITSGAQAQSIPGIGQSIGSKIDEILATGSIQDLLQVSTADKQKQEIIKIFRGIHGVGKAQAEKWFASGYRSLLDLVPLYTSGQMTAAQQLGFFYYNDLQLRIPRSEIQELELILRQIWNPLGIEFVIAGSYRRGLPESGDIDILVKQQPMPAVLIPLIKSNLIVGNLTPDAEVKSMLISKVTGKPARRMDIRIIDQKSWPFALLYFTGSKNFNIVIRRWALSRGWSLSEYGFSNGQGQVVDLGITSEEDIFKFLELRFQSPVERTDTAEVSPLQQPTPTVVQVMKETGQWLRPANSLLVYFSDAFLGRVRASLGPKIVAGFDLDHTLIHHRSGKTFSSDLADIEFLPQRLPILSNLIVQGYFVIIFTNQKSVSTKKQEQTLRKLQHVVEIMNLPIMILAALADDEYRKPRQGMWKAVEQYLTAIDWQQTFYCGDAAGRPNDFSDSDSQFAQLRGVKFFTPEELFGASK